MSRFVHLHVHTEYSLVDSVVRIDSERKDDGSLVREGLVDACARLGMPAVAVTDQGNLFAMVKFYRAAQARGVKPIVGVDVLVREEGERAEPSRLVLLCQDERGYANLTRLVSRAYLEGQGKHGPTVQPPGSTATRRRGSSRCRAPARVTSAGPCSPATRTMRAARSRRWLKLFDDRYYLELQRTGRPGEEDCIAGSLALAVKRGVPVVATNDVRFIRRDDFEAHEARVCIHEGALLDDPRARAATARSSTCARRRRWAKLFADLPEALENTVEIADGSIWRCASASRRLPAYPVPGGTTIEDHLREEARAGSRRAQALAAAPGWRAGRAARTTRGSRPSSTSSARWASPATS